MPRFVSIKYREYAVVSDKEKLKASSIHILFPLEKLIVKAVTKNVTSVIKKALL